MSNTSQLCQKCQDIFRGIKNPWTNLQFFEEPFYTHHDSIQGIEESGLRGCQLCRQLHFKLKGKYHRVRESPRSPRSSDPCNDRHSIRYQLLSTQPGSFILRFSVWRHDEILVLESTESSRNEKMLTGYRTGWSWCEFYFENEDGMDDV